MNISITHISNMSFKQLTNTGDYWTVTEMADFLDGNKGILPSGTFTIRRWKADSAMTIHDCKYCRSCGICRTCKKYNKNDVNNTPCGRNKNSSDLCDCDKLFDSVSKCYCIDTTVLMVDDLDYIVWASPLGGNGQSTIRVQGKDFHGCMYYEAGMYSFKIEL